MRVCAKAVSSTNTQRERKTEKRERKKKIGRERGEGEGNIFICIELCTWSALGQYYYGLRWT